MTGLMGLMDQVEHRPQQRHDRYCQYQPKRHMSLQIRLQLNRGKYLEIMPDSLAEA